MALDQKTPPVPPAEHLAADGIEPDFQPAATKTGLVIAVGVSIGAVLYVLAQLVDKSYGTAFFATPFFIGVGCGSLSSKAPYRTALYALLIACALTIVTLREGVLCVLWSLPLLLPLLMIGAWVGRLLTRHVKSVRRRRATVHTILLLGIGSHFLEAHWDDPTRHPLHRVQSSILVGAPPEAVFRALTQPTFSVASRWPWFIRIGLPMPQRMSIDNPGPTATLRFDFDQGTAFGHVTVWTPGRALSYRVDRFEMHDLPFHITRLGHGPNYGFRPEQIGDWLSLDSTEYRFTRAGTQTLLERRLVWRRHLFPDFYFGWLQDVLMRRGQERLLELVKQRVEARPAPASDMPAVARSESLKDTANAPPDP